MSDKNNNSGKRNSGNRNSGNRNSGNCNSGDCNSGYYNSGYCNSGNRNSGNYNSGDYNSGYYNPGNRNSGNRNSGYRNSGNRNSGDCNSGDCNSGYCNSGYYNSGNYNSGYYNSGDCNSGNRNSGFFNTNEPTVRLFNKDTGLKRNEINIPHINLEINEWVPEDKMTNKQKVDDPNFHVKQGTLINRTYEEAWALYWSGCSKEDKQKFLGLPNFDAEIFKEITGIGVESNSCNGKIVEIDGKKYKLEEVK